MTVEMLVFRHEHDLSPPSLVVQPSPPLNVHLHHNDSIRDGILYEVYTKSSLKFRDDLWIR